MIPVLRAHHFSKGLSGFTGYTQSKQRRIELLLRYKRAKTSRNCVKHLETVSLLWMEPASSKMMRAQHLESRLLDNTKNYTITKLAETFSF